MKAYFSRDEAEFQMRFSLPDTEEKQQQDLWTFIFLYEYCIVYSVQSTSTVTELLRKSVNKLYSICYDILYNELI